MRLDLRVQRLDGRRVVLLLPAPAVRAAGQVQPTIDMPADDRFAAGGADAARTARELRVCLRARFCAVVSPGCRAVRAPVPPDFSSSWVLPYQTAPNHSRPSIPPEVSTPCRRERRRSQRGSSVVRPMMKKPAHRRRPTHRSRARHGPRSGKTSSRGRRHPQLHLTQSTRWGAVAACAAGLAVRAFRPGRDRFRRVGVQSRPRRAHAQAVPFVAPPCRSPRFPRATGRARNCGPSRQRDGIVVSSMMGAMRTIRCGPPIQSAWALPATIQSSARETRGRFVRMPLQLIQRRHLLSPVLASVPRQSRRSSRAS